MSLKLVLWVLPCSLRGAGEACTMWGNAVLARKARRAGGVATNGKGAPVPADYVLSMCGECVQILVGCRLKKASECEFGYVSEYWYGGGRIEGWRSVLEEGKEEGVRCGNRIVRVNGLSDRECSY